MPVQIKKKQNTSALGGETSDHPSFGCITWSRQQWGTNKAHLFQSPTANHDVISIKISHAQLNRDLAHDWIFAKDRITEVYLTVGQFAEFMTSPNRGDGVPCTIGYTENLGSVDLPEQESKYETYKKEAALDLIEIKERLDTLADTVDNMLTGRGLRKADLKKVQGSIKGLHQHLMANMPFLKEQFDKHMVRTVVAAKQEVEGFIEARIRETGLQQLDQAAPTLLTHED